MDSKTTLVLDRQSMIEPEEFKFHEEKEVRIPLIKIVSPDDNSTQDQTPEGNNESNKACMS